MGGEMGETGREFEGEKEKWENGNQVWDIFEKKCPRWRYYIK
jgi:hypothetical protein